MKIHEKQDVCLADVSPFPPASVSKEEAKADYEKSHAKIISYQGRLYAERKQSLLVVFQAMDTGGKDGAIKSIFSGINPQGIYVASFKAPTVEEKEHDFLWRIHKHTPGKGHVAVFNRSHYEDVLVPRVESWISKDECNRRYDSINDFETLLTDNGTRVLKFFLHIDKDEQKQRLEARLADPEKNWKFSSGDLPVREKWDDYMAAYEKMFDHCSLVPWHIVPANKKWYRDSYVSSVIEKTLVEMDPKYPAPEAGLDKIVIV